MSSKYLVLFTMCLGTLISAYTGGCVILALPDIMAALNFNMDSIVWGNARVHAALWFYNALDPEN